MKNIHSATLFFFTLGLLAGCQSPDVSRKLESSACPIINGQPDTSSEHMAVTYLHLIRSDGGFACSGTLIAPNVVMSAGHCVVTDSGEVMEPQGATVYFGNVVGTMTERKVTQVIAHPGYQPIVPVPNDISLLVLAEDAPGWAVPIPPLPASLRITSADVGSQVEYVGFGLDENGDLGRKLHVTGDIDVVCESGGCPASMVPSSFCAQMDDGGTCSGDSGGPAFYIRDEVEYVAGITSYGDWRCSNYGCSTKVDGHSAFIDDVIGTSKELGDSCVSAGQCNSGFCVDGFCCQSACAEPCNACDLAKKEGQCLPAPDGHACLDADPCNGSESCLANACISDGLPPDCTSDSPCLSGACVTGQGCVYSPIADGTACDNHDVCDGDDQCHEGRCDPAGASLDCDDGNVCTEDSCNSVSGCLHENVDDDTSCVDDDLCNGDEICTAGVCRPGTALDCDDQNSCTEDSCDSGSGCMNDVLEEGTSCGAGRNCQDGLCLPGKGGSGCATAGGSQRSSLPLLPLLCLLLALPLRRFG
ncbi:MAG TPA: trypsin-like serine protease [Myxococcota bacterium]|nr:trypsin-like serine protease [Myxococcota bacterium]